MLKEIVDETSRGRYDFMYLRIGKQVEELSNARLIKYQTLRTTASVSHHPDPLATASDPCSVGYAFINFEDVSAHIPKRSLGDELIHYQSQYIIDVSCRLQQFCPSANRSSVCGSGCRQTLVSFMAWPAFRESLLIGLRNRFNSDKVAEVSYASESPPVSISFLSLTT